MTTVIYSHPIFLNHETGPGHPECTDRLRVIQSALKAPEFSHAIRKEAPRGTKTQILSTHSKDHLDRLMQAVPSHGLIHLDRDTLVSSHSLDAAFHAVGAVCDAVDMVMNCRADNAFCAARPPGHHAERNQAMGFCLFNNIAIAANHARARYSTERVAIIDFDVHHGNGTQDIFQHQTGVLYASSHEMPLYPGTGNRNETGAGNLFNAPLSPGADSTEFRNAMKEIIFPAVNDFQPELLLVSAGFDAHWADPLASVRLTEDDFRWITRELLQIANRHCSGRLVSTLEGGYDLQALKNSTATHVRELLRNELQP
jgi:acetoin utilization deacetylase AcuC-like enzyme